MASKEVTLQQIIELIENHDHQELDKCLQEDASHINDYYNMDVGTEGLAVKMTPLQFAVKQKSPSCIDVLLKHGANHKMKLKTPEDKNLPITALKLAQGEKDVALKHNETEDAELYDEIIKVLNGFTNSKETKTEEPTGGSEAVSNIASPTLSREYHKLSLVVSQNQLSIKNLERENSKLKSELDELKKDMSNVKKWVEKWIYDESGNAPKTPSKDTSSKDSESKSTRTAASRARKKDNGEEHSSKKRQRPQSVMVTANKSGTLELDNPHKRKSPSAEHLDNVPNHKKESGNHKKSPTRVSTVSSSTTKSKKEDKESKDNKDNKDHKDHKDKKESSGGKHKKTPTRRETIGSGTGKDKEKKSK